MAIDQATRERITENLELYRDDIARLINELIQVLHCDDFEDQRAELENEAWGLHQQVESLGPRTQREIEEAYADECVNEMRNG